MGVQHPRFGPVEADGRAPAILSWPDPKGLGAKAQTAILAGDAAIPDPAAFADQSVAARGLLALERLPFQATPFADDTCPLLRATASDVARIAALVSADWQRSFATRLKTAGDDGNTNFLSTSEERQVLFTQPATALEFLDDQRLGRPLGTFDAPRPDSAEARASGRSLRNVTLAVVAIRQRRSRCWVGGLRASRAGLRPHRKPKPLACGAMPVPWPGAAKGTPP